MPVSLLAPLFQVSRSGWEQEDLEWREGKGLPFSVKQVYWALVISAAHCDTLSHHLEEATDVALLNSAEEQQMQQLQPDSPAKQTPSYIAGSGF